MNLNSVLNSVLRGGLGSVLGGGARGGAMGGLGGLAGPAAASAALGMLLGGRGDKLLRLGGMAALGMMAYKAWQEYQAKQAGSAAPPFQQQPPAAQEPPAQAEAHSRALLVAMIAAAKADGHVNDAERAQITQALKQSDDAEVAAWFEQELKRPLDPAEVARAAGGDGALASEIYLASLLVAQAADGRIGFMERSYLDELARQLKLPDGLKATLEGQAQQAG
jgi:uncharacterized membrane protein YebE (DUF533 family)